MTDREAPPAIVGESAAAREIRSTIVQVARTDLPVLIVGPTGAGKELVAQSLHHVSRRSGLCVAVNVCAIGESMFEASLFGHVRGAFTGAIRDSGGLLLEADGGTLFLDEISGLPPAAQAKLLRAIETRVFRPVGGSRDRRSAFRVVSATNEPLDELAAEGRFRWDLLHRLSGIVIAIPPLRDRLDDIPMLIRHFVATNGLGASGVTVDDGGMRALQQHDWPGNVRELRHVLERSAALSPSTALGRDDIMRALAHGQRPKQNEVDLAERDRLVDIMELHHWDTAAAAARFGVHRGTIYRWLQRFGISRPHRRILLTSASESKVRSL